MNQTIFHKSKGLICLLFLLVLSSSAQGFRTNIAFWQKLTPAWIKTIGGTSSDSARSVAVDSSGNIYVAGTYVNDSSNSKTVTDFNGAALNGTKSTLVTNVYVAKLDSSGTVQWIKTMGGNAFPDDITLDSSGNVYVVGYYNNDSANTKIVIDFSGATLNGKTSTASNDGFVAKLNNSGVQQWIKTIGGTGLDDAKAVAVDSSGNVYAGGGYSNDSSNSKTVTDFSGATLNGKTTGAVHDAYVAKFDASGNQLWIKTLGGSSTDRVNTLAVDGSSNVYVGGQFVNDSSNTNSVTDFSGATLNGKSTTAGYDAYVAKLNTSGTHQWTKTLGGSDYDAVHGMRLDNSDNIYAAGSYSNDSSNSKTVTGFDGTSINGLTTLVDSDVFMIKLDTNGTQQLIKTMGGQGADNGYSVAVDSSGNIYVAGYYENDSINTNTVKDFSGATLNGKTTTISGEAFVVRLNASGTQQWIKTLGGTYSNELAKKVAVGSGNVYVVGEYRNDSINTNTVTDFAGDILYGKTASNTSEGFLAKFK